jgi:hypothetical protein
MGVISFSETSGPPISCNQYIPIAKKVTKRCVYWSAKRTEGWLEDWFWVKFFRWSSEISHLQDLTVCLSPWDVSLGRSVLPVKSKKKHVSQFQASCAGCEREKKKELEKRWISSSRTRHRWWRNWRLINIPQVTKNDWMTREMWEHLYRWLV